jgi:tRNA G37 N-methylase TrmD
MDEIKYWLVVGLVMLVTGAFNANALRVDSGDNKTIYFDESGKRLDAIEAFKQAMSDHKVLKCDYYEAVGNQRTGKVNLKKKQ